MGRFPVARYAVRWLFVACVVAVPLAACGEGSLAAASKDDPPGMAADVGADMGMGTNLDGLAYWSTALPTLDVMKSAGGWLPQADGSYDTGETVPLDRDGWALPSADPAGRRYRSLVVNVIHDNPAAPHSARYVVLYDGTGQIAALDVDGGRIVSQAPGEMHVEAGRGGSLYLRLDASASLRNIRVVREDYLPLYRAGLTFNPDFLARIDAFQVLRFMDWMNTNALFAPTGGPITDEAAINAAPQINWADRPRPSSMHWGEGSRGVPVEALVEIANRTGAEPWFTMPVNASDDYVRGFAAYVREHLRPDLKIHVELSNEVWNWIFPQARYAQAQARRVFGPNGDWLEWYGMRAAQVGMIWKKAFNEPERRSSRAGRVSMVFGTQFAWRGLEAKGLDTSNWRDAEGRQMRASDYFDEYAITAYYDGTMNTDETVPVVKGWWKDSDGGYARAVAALDKRIADFNAPLYRYHAEQAKAHGLRLVSYESGFGEYTPISQHDNEAYTDFLVKLQRRPEFTALETANYTAFAAAGGRLFMNFGIIGTPSKWGSWSALESVGQETSPRYSAMMAWLAAHPPSRLRGPAVAYAPARLMIGKPGGSTLTQTAHGYDVLVGTAGDDRFIASGAPGGRIDGGGGTDTLVLPAKREAYRFGAEADQGSVRVEGPGGGQDISHVALVRFGEGRPVALAQLLSEDRGLRLADVERVGSVPAPK